MKRDWIRYLNELFAWTGVASIATSTAAAGAVPMSAAIESLNNSDRTDTPPLTFERPHTNSGIEQFAAHRSHSSHSSHRSHSSHSSHSSGSGGGYVPAPAAPVYRAPSTLLSPAPSTSTTAKPATSPTAKSPPSEQEKLVMVMRAQAKLFTLGFFKGLIDGKLGEATLDALKRYQLVKGLSASGKLDDATLLALGVTY